MPPRARAHVREGQKRNKNDISLTLTTPFANFYTHNETLNRAYIAVKQFFRLTKDFYCRITFYERNVLTKQLLQYLALVD